MVMRGLSWAGWLFVVVIACGDDASSAGAGSDMDASLDAEATAPGRSAEGQSCGGVSSSFGITCCI